MCAPKAGSQCRVWPHPPRKVWTGRCSVLLRCRVPAAPQGESTSGTWPWLVRPDEQRTCQGVDTSPSLEKVSCWHDCVQFKREVLFRTSGAAGKVTAFHVVMHLQFSSRLCMLQSLVCGRCARCRPCRSGRPPGLRQRRSLQQRCHGGSRGGHSISPPVWLSRDGAAPRQHACAHPSGACGGRF